MKTLSIVSHKGGAGKTSSAVMFAEDLARRGLRVVLVDADRQAGAGLLLGIDTPSGTVQQTQNPRLRYFCCSGMPLRELPAKAVELDGLFDVAVVDTPSLDDPLARGWMQVATHSLMVLPVEPVSLKTLDAAESALESIRKLNENIQICGILPTMFDETDTTQRTLMLELRSRQPEGLLPNYIPLDPDLAHRAEQKVERRTQPTEKTRDAYRVAGDILVQSMGLTELCQSGQSVSFSNWSPPRTPRAEAPAAAAAAGRMPQPKPAAVPAGAPPRSEGGASPLRWAVAAFAVLVLLILGLGLFLRPGHASELTGSHVGRPAAAVMSGSQH